MQDKINIIANIIQKIAIWKSKTMDRSDKLREHIRMLDWVIGRNKFTRDINDIINDKDYELSPRDFLLKFES